MGAPHAAHGWAREGPHRSMSEPSSRNGAARQAQRAGRSRTRAVPREGPFSQALLVPAPTPLVQSIREKINAATNTMTATTLTGML